MKLTHVLIVCALLLVSLACAQGNAGAGAAPAPVATTPAPTTTNAAAAAAPALTVAAKGKNQVGGANGYVKTSPETEALWKQLGQTETDLRAKQWELYVLLNATPVDKQAVRAKLGELRTLNTQLHDTRDKLAPSWVALSAREMAGGKGGGKHHGKGQTTTPQAAPGLPTPAATTPAATPAAPAAGN